LSYIFSQAFANRKKTPNDAIPRKNIPGSQIAKSISIFNPPFKKFLNRILVSFTSTFFNA